MNSERRAIVGLVAAGRITASEAERLLRVFNDGREGLWIVLACLALCLVQLHLSISLHAVGQWAHWAAAEWIKTVETAGSALLKGMGGKV